MKTIFYLGFLMAFAISCNEPGAGNMVAGENDSSGIDRTILPIREPASPTYTELDARDAKAPQRFEVTAPQGAPNVVVVLLDDIGFGAARYFWRTLQYANTRPRCQTRLDVQLL